MTTEEMMECGRNVGATHMVVRTCLMSDVRFHPQVIYVMPGQSVEEAKKSMENTTGYLVETFDLRLK